MFTMNIAGSVGNTRSNTVNGANGQTPVLNFSVAVKMSKKDQNGKPLTQWVECSLWGKRAESLGQYITKGTKVAVTGEPGVEVFQNQNSGQAMPKMTLNVDQITLLGGGQQQNAGNGAAPGMQQNGMNGQMPPQQNPGAMQQGGMGQNQQMPPQQQAPAYATGGMNDDVPFSNYELRTLA